MSIRDKIAFGERVYVGKSRLVALWIDNILECTDDRPPESVALILKDDGSLITASFYDITLERA